MLLGIAGKSNEMWQEVVSLYNNLEPEVPIVQEPEQTTCALRNVQSPSGEKASAVTNAEGAHRQNKKQCRTSFCPKVLVGADLEKAMAGYQSVGRPSSVDGSPLCWTCEGCTGLNPLSAQRCLVEGCGLEQVQPSFQEPIPREPVKLVHAADVNSKKKTGAKVSGNTKGNARKRG